MECESVAVRPGRQWQVFTNGSGPPTIWLHGIRGVDADDPVLTALSNGRRVIAPVAPGFNDLDELSEIDNIHELALDYDDLFAHLGLESVDVIGHSFGGMIAAEIAAHFPNRVRTLTLLAPFGLWNDAYQVPDIFAIPYTQLDDSLWYDDKARERFAKPAVTTDDIQVTADRTIALARGLTAITKFTWPIPDRGLRRRLRRIAAPTLCLFGDADSIISPRYGDDLKAGIPHLQIGSVAGAGHMLTYEQPEKVLRQFNDFVRQSAQH
jgi:pimeloyl-ACP methyl ester carboxylesterase